MNPIVTKRLRDALEAATAIRGWHTVTTPGIRVRMRTEADR